MINNIIGSDLACLFFTFSSDLKKMFQFVAGQPDPR